MDERSLFQTTRRSINCGPLWIWQLGEVPVSEIPGGGYVFYRSGGMGFDIDRLYSGVGPLKEGYHGESGR